MWGRRKVVNSQAKELENRKVTASSLRQGIFISLVRKFMLGAHPAYLKQEISKDI